MQAENYVQTVMALHKTAFESSFSALSMVQELKEKAIQTACGQVPWIPDQGKVMIDHWVSSMQEGRSTFQQAMSKSFEQMSEALCRQASEVSSHATGVVQKMADQVSATGRQASEVRSHTAELVQKLADQVVASGRHASETAQMMAQTVIGDPKKNHGEGNGRKKRT
jgi:polyhydroxyalkanoate synthesis regulator phasin